MQPMWIQADPILDVLLLDSGATMLVLSPAKLSSYKMTDGKWILAGVAAISTTRPLPRDPRGRLAIGPRIYLPGATCAIQPDFRAACTSENARWPLNSSMVRWQTDRNLLETDRGAVYSTAAGIFITVDGHAQDRTGETVAGADGWGSDLAAIDNACGTDPVVVVSKSGDGRDRDEVQTYEITSGSARAASEPLSLPGVITALWPSETPRQATLVVRNSKTGNYEASRVALACAE